MNFAYNNFAHNIDDILSFLFPGLFVAAILIWGFGMTAAIRRGRAPEPQKKAAATRQTLIAWLSFMVIIGGWAAASGVVTAAARDEVEAQLAGKIVAATVDGKPLAKPDGLVAEIRAMNTSPLRYHHSHPTRRYKVELQLENATLVLNLARDSSDPHDYWVLYPKYKVTGMNDIGRVETSFFDKL